MLRRLIRKFQLRGLTFPVYDVAQPAALVGQTNGKLPDALLTAWPLAQGGTGHTLSGAPYRSWVALQWLAKLYRAALLTATSPADTYRSYGQQVAGFLARNTTKPIPTTSRRMWNGVWYYLKPGNAGIAVPGTSNHGWAMAVDHGILKGRSVVRPTDWLAWFIPQAVAAGWSWESSSEDWHVRYCMGDQVSPVVAAVERAKGVHLAVGSTGAAVKLVQTKLGGLTVDGQYGPKTAARVKTWQTHQTTWYGGEGLPVDGIIDADDWYVLVELGS